MTWEGLERRRFPRAKFPCKIIAHTLSEHTLVSHTENIGEGGVRVILDEKLSVHSKVGLEIYLEQEPIKCRGRIVWVIDIAHPLHQQALLFDTGIEFLDLCREDADRIKELVERLLARKGE